MPVPDLKPGEVLVRNHFLSLDPYMRGRMSEAKSYASSQALDETMIGGTAGEVVASNNPKFAVGDQVVGMMGWAEMGVDDGRNLRKVDVTHVPLSAYLGAVGMPGMTAWYGLNQIMHRRRARPWWCRPPAARSAARSGQLAKQRGCRAVGIAGGPEKCAYVVEELGFDACVDYKAGNLKEDLKAAAPNGIDGIFENVGGEVFDARAVADQCVRAHRAVRPDLRLQRRGNADPQHALPADQPHDAARLHRHRAHGILAAGPCRTRHAGRRPAS